MECHGMVKRVNLAEEGDLFFGEPSWRAEAPSSREEVGNGRHRSLLRPVLRGATGEKDHLVREGCGDAGE
ncbi:hypothetical protein CDL15_Pgr005182 [Punica granatum]|uniref:Uncharacterized protein n=1 Tax=Punica granatum TaxID=22663 RepID=A0A218WRL2_PUNGR|nr:hypothetical protein CDL15_Pgr005182 [Punica granatum]